MKQIIGLILILVGLGFIFHLPILNLIFAGVLVYLGLMIIFGKGMCRKDCSVSKTGDGYIDETVVFGSVSRKIEAGDVRDGKITVVFGEGTIDLRGVDMRDGAELEAVSVFGKATIIVPKNWRVHSKGASVLGEFSVKTDSEGNGPRVNLKGAAVFGVVEIIN